MVDRGENGSPNGVDEAAMDLDPIDSAAEECSDLLSIPKRPPLPAGLRRLQTHILQVNQKDSLYYHYSGEKPDITQYCAIVVE